MMIDLTFEEYCEVMKKALRETDDNLPNIEKLPFPDELKKKLYSFVYNKNRKHKNGGCALIGCPDGILMDVVSAIAYSPRLKLKIIDFKTMVWEKDVDFIAELTSFTMSSLVILKNIQHIKPFLNVYLNNAILNNKLHKTFGKGEYAQSIDIDLDFRYFITVADNKKDIPVDFFEKIYTIIDFTEFKDEIRRANALTTFEKYNLTATEEVLNQLSKLNVSEQDFTMCLLELRNMAYEANITEITESMLLGSKKNLPGIDVVNQMDGREFELFTGDLFRALGYTNVSVTPASGDFGADVIAEKDDVKFAIQCKRYSAPVGVSAVQEVLASKSLHDCHVACILTNNAFTPAAEALAKKNLVILWGGDKLQEFINRAKV